MSDDAVIDPYGGLRESWSKEVLDAASQDAGIVFDHPVARAALPVNQIALPSVAHFEACGPTAMAVCAAACGLITDPVANILAALNFLGAASVAASGTGTQQLLSWAANQGWKVHQDNRPAGDLDEALAASGLIGISALDTAYGTGPLWNTLHPQQGGGIGHWETVGCLVPAAAPEEDVMTPAQLLNVKRIAVWMVRLQHENWPPGQVDIDAFAGQIGDDLNFEPVITALNQTFETNHQPSEFELLEAVKAKVGA
jgi:hypothetical protein